MAEAKVNHTEEEFYYFCKCFKMGYRQTRLPFISISSQEIEFSCVKCKVRFSSGFKMKKPYFDDRYPHRYEVCVCVNRYPNSTQLLYHSYHHTDAWPFKCNFCQKGFPLKSRYERHFTTKTVQCRKCSASFQGKFCSARRFRENDDFNCEKCSSASNLTIDLDYLEDGDKFLDTLFATYL
ncbi:hypothetical protein TNCT_422361 [Trichonephila clavata]|uniref:C2H2-type domain-containing protein n=1 Tax=Trichonephila clavata TaxID=2740835 RepID=A0A8X6IP42_TRICU|nr:hypothetical protein TNCT_422361 [Trichonephila clavata]